MLMGGKLLLTVSEAMIDNIANGNKPRNKLSSGLAKLLISTNKDIETVISVLISEIPK